MRGYVARSLYQLYLLVFWPSRFEADGYAGGAKPLAARVLALVNLTAWLAVIGAATTAVAFAILMAAPVAGEMWLSASLLVTVSVGASTFIGLVASAARGLLLGGAAFTTRNWLYGGACAALLCVVAFWDSPREETFFLGLAFVFMFGATAGLSAGVSGGARMGFVAGVGVGTFLGIGFGVCAGPSFGVVLGNCFVLTFCAYYYRLSLYPLQAGLMAVAFLTARVAPRYAGKALRCSPLYWDEVIWLPLPFADVLLIDLVRRDRDEGFRAIAFVARERGLQRWAAVRATEVLVVDDLRVASVGDIAHSAALRWSAGADLELPPDLHAGLAVFARVSNYVDQYLALQNVHRQLSSLNRALEELGAVEKRLVFARGAYAPPLRRIAGEWAALIRAESDRLAAQSGDPELPNPFVFGNPVKEQDSAAFVGRQEVAHQLVGGILGSLHVPALLLHGARRMGKSSILYQFPRLLGPDFARALVDCQNPAACESEAGLLRLLSRAIAGGLSERRIALPELTRQELSEEPYATFGDWVERVERALPDGMRVLVCLDEYEHLDRAVRAGWGGRMLDQIRHLIQHRSRLLWVFAGARTFPELGPDWTSRFVSVRRIRISFLSPAELGPLLTDRSDVPGFDLTYAEGAVAMLLARTNGQPFLVQAVAYELVQYLNEGRRRRATAEDVETAIRRALNTGAAYFEDVWADADADAQRVLTAVAAADSIPDFPDAIRRLRERDVLTPEMGFAVPMMREWVRSGSACGSYRR